MTNPTNWPNPERPGVPMFPEQDGWHSLRTYSLGLFFWDSANKYWWDSQKRFYRTIPEILKDTVGTKYIAPLPNPHANSRVAGGGGGSGARRNASGYRQLYPAYSHT